MTKSDSKTEACDKSGTDDFSHFPLCLYSYATAVKNQVNIVLTQSATAEMTFGKRPGSSSVTHMSKGSGQKHCAHMDEHCDMRGQGNRPSKTHM